MIANVTKNNKHPLFYDSLRQMSLVCQLCWWANWNTCQPCLTSDRMSGRASCPADIVQGLLPGVWLTDRNAKNRLSPVRWWILLALLFMSHRYVLLHTNVLALHTSSGHKNNPEPGRRGRQWMKHNTISSPHWHRPLAPLTEELQKVSDSFALFHFQLLSIWRSKMSL